MKIYIAVKYVDNYRGAEFPPSPLKLIQAIKPDILCKGADYKRKQDVVGWDFVESYGGCVELIEFVEGRSTSNIIKKLNGE